MIQKGCTLRPDEDVSDLVVLVASFTGGVFLDVKENTTAKMVGDSVARSCAIDPTKPSRNRENTTFRNQTWRNMYPHLKVLRAPQPLDPVAQHSHKCVKQVEENKKVCSQLQYEQRTCRRTVLTINKRRVNLFEWKHMALKRLAGRKSACISEKSAGDVVPMLITRFALRLVSNICIL